MGVSGRSISFGANDKDNGTVELITWSVFLLSVSFVDTNGCGVQLVAASLGKSNVPGAALVPVFF